jgi:hypothetical protein
MSLFVIQEKSTSKIRLGIWVAVCNDEVECEAAG